jgi:hypothetical protein
MIPTVRLIVVLKELKPLYLKKSKTIREWWSYYSLCTLSRGIRDVV